ncbi:hypothetical protein A2U01_0114620, partial [Trifolium medium]|nr:hypothetical protein [Trifolium medium]
MVLEVNASLPPGVGYRRPGMGLARFYLFMP